MSAKSEELNKKQIFLLLFTLQMIRSSNKVDELKQIIKSETEGQISAPEEKETTKQKHEEISEGKDHLIKSIISQTQRPVPEEISVIKPVKLKTSRMELSENPRLPMRVLRIPEPRLPPEFQYLKPIPMAKEIDLGKLNPLIYDHAVQSIECEGPDKPLIVTGSMGRKPTSITLSNQELEDIIQRFSSASKIPAENGVYKVVVGRLIFSAIISDVVPSRFMIRKMHIENPPANPYRTMNPNYNLFFGRHR